MNLGFNKIHMNKNQLTFLLYVGIVGIKVPYFYEGINFK